MTEEIKTYAVTVCESSTMFTENTYEVKASSPEEAQRIYAAEGDLTIANQHTEYEDNKSIPDEIIRVMDVEDGLECDIIEQTPAGEALLVSICERATKDARDLLDSAKQSVLARQPSAITIEGEIEERVSELRDDVEGSHESWVLYHATKMEVDRLLLQDELREAVPEEGTVWLATCEDIFGGYGIRAVGSTRKDATEALWKIYTTTSEEWNKDRVSNHPISSFEELDETWGVRVHKMTLGTGYMGGFSLGEWNHLCPETSDLRPETSDNTEPREIQ